MCVQNSEIKCRIYFPTQKGGVELQLGNTDKFSNNKGTGTGITLPIHLLTNKIILSMNE